MRNFLVAQVLCLLSLSANASAEVITIYKDPNCGCCIAWAEHISQAGYAMKVIDREDISEIKKQLGVPESLRSCHTGVIGATGQVIEGHVPATVIPRLIASRPTQGVAVPGMPANSPGMGRMDGKLVTVDFSGREFSRN